ncbi:hypothetical protein ACRALDRAFT_212522 [Sodiomyces alcalophilus JCM 7366]|uniref:uncharacterized protein n=1 Tax=Sodiomyces alcalophilus JCM 7366 TaxID=591952 RepID=UPI0039B5388F
MIRSQVVPRRIEVCLTDTNRQSRQKTPKCAMLSPHDVESNYTINAGREIIPSFQHSQQPNQSSKTANRMK